MARDPWKRAYELSQTAPPPLPPDRPQRGSSWLWILLPLLAVSGVLTLYFLGYLRLPAREKLVEVPVVEPLVQASEKSGPRVKVDIEVLDSGLGIGLKLYADYLDIFVSTREWKIPWEIKTTGSGTLRITAPGVTIFTRGGLVSTFELDLEDLETALSEDGGLLWAAWLPELSRAGLKSGVRKDRFSGLTSSAAEPNALYFSGAASIPVNDGFAHPQYMLRFSDSRLAALSGGSSFDGRGAAEIGGADGGRPALPAVEPAG